MNTNILALVQSKTQIALKSITETLKLLEEECTIPFISRYRKEVTGNLDEEQVRLIEKVYNDELNVYERRESIIKILKEKEKLTPELLKELKKATTLNDLENVYLPYKEKRKTRASVAIENGLEPLANLLLSNENIDFVTEAEKYINENFKDARTVLSGALDILAERVAYTPNIREIAKNEIKRVAYIKTKLKKGAVDENKNFEMYYDKSEKYVDIKNHRILAIERGTKLKILTTTFEYEIEPILNDIAKEVIKYKTTALPFLNEMLKDAGKRLLFPSLENELYNELYSRAEKEAINLFCLNLEQLLLTPPFKNKAILGFDPSFRTGCKLAVIDEKGTFKEKSVIYPNQKYQGEEVPKSRILEAEIIVERLISKYDVSLVAIGNGTASRESEEFIANTLNKFHLNAKYLLVSEAGASVYSASKNAQKEFPDLHVEERSAISIARRVIDPLSELIKIDPKSIGVGQYQHDVNQKDLQASLEFTTSKIVNKIGVNVNTASQELLSYVSGLNAKIAQNIIDYREKSTILTRQDILNIKGINDKVYEQCIGFLKVLDSPNPFDKTFIHPEHYTKVSEFITKIGCSIKDFNSPVFQNAVSGVDEKSFAKFGFSLETFKDILHELKEPLFDYRDQYPAPVLKANILHAEDLMPGMKLQGTVRSIVDFGVFVDIGLKNNGFVHISKLAKRFVKNPMEVVSVGDIVEVYVIEYNKEKGRISLSLFPVSDINK